MIASGNNYAQALFILACEENLLEQFQKEMSFLSDCFEQNPEYIKFLSSPAIAKANRTETINKIFGGKISEYLLSFVCILCEQGKISSFFECVKEFERLKKWYENCVTATVKSAVELTDAQKKRLIEKLQKISGKRVVLETQISDGVIGGLVVEMDGMLIDGSVKNNLNHIKEVIEK